MTWATLKDDAAFLETNLTVLADKDQTFARSLLDQFADRGLSAKQEYWVSTLAERARERLARPVVEAAPAPKLDLTRILAMFDAAANAGKHNPHLLVYGGLEQLETLRITVSKSPRYPGLNVSDNSPWEERVWLGGISEDGTYRPSKQARELFVEGYVTQALQALAADPEGQARAFGQRFNICCFCSRELTDQRSVVAGYGPVCAEKFGLAWGVCEDTPDD